jgi:hypothetical protein
MTDDRKPEDRSPSAPLGPNSDPTGIGPPPAGSVTHVTPDGHGVTQAPGLTEDEKRSGPAEPAT